MTEAEKLEHALRLARRHMEDFSFYSVVEDDDLQHLDEDTQEEIFDMVNNDMKVVIDN